jgi:hypothetical protein
LDIQYFLKRYIIAVTISETLLCFWQLWKHRNGVVFRAQNPSLALLMRQCRETAHLWRVRLPEDHQADVDSWIARFPSVTLFAAPPVNV